MTSILIVDDDRPLRSALHRDLTFAGHDVRLAESASEALVVLGEWTPDVLLTDLRMGGEDGIDLLAKVPAIASPTRAILMSGFATAAEHQKATELGAVRVLCKPFTPDELREAIDQAVECQSGVQGSVHGLSLVDLLQIFHLGRRSLSIRVSGAQVGAVYLDKGEICHAEHGELRGRDALIALLRIDSGAIQTGPACEVERTIDLRFDALLLDILRELDEGRAGGSAAAGSSDEEETLATLMLLDVLRDLGMEANPTDIGKLESWPCFQAWEPEPSLPAEEEGGV